MKKNNYMFIVKILVLLSIVCGISFLVYSKVYKREEVIDNSTNGIIKRYHLENIKDEIYENEDLFSKFSDVIEKNDKLGNFKREVYLLFKAVADNTELLDEKYFLDCVSKLWITENGEEELVAGTFSYLDYHINVDTKLDAVVSTGGGYYHSLIHELFHFLDFSMSEIYGGYYCDNHIYTMEEYKSINDEYNDCFLWGLSIAEPTFFVEGGAEYYSAYYLENDNVTTYNSYVACLRVLEKVLGKEKVRKMFISSNTFFEFYKFLQDNYNYDTDKVADLIEKIEDIDIPSDGIVMLCEYLNIKWYEDPDIRYAISRLIDDYDDWKLQESKYYNEYKKYYDNKGELIGILRGEVLSQTYNLLNPEGNYQAFANAYMEDGVLHISANYYVVDTGEKHYFQAIADLEEETILSIEEKK